MRRVSSRCLSLALSSDWAGMAQRGERLMVDRGVPFSPVGVVPRSRPTSWGLQWSSDLLLVGSCSPELVARLGLAILRAVREAYVLVRPEVLVQITRTVC